jgi:hypothetical protein
MLYFKMVLYLYWSQKVVIQTKHHLNDNQFKNSIFHLNIWSRKYLRLFLPIVNPINEILSLKN